MSEVVRPVIGSRGDHGGSGPAGAPAASGASILRSLSRALALLWATHRAYTLLLVALTALSGLLAPVQLALGRLLIDAVARFLPNAPAAGPAAVRGLLLLVGAQAGVMLFGALLGALGGYVRTVLADLLGNHVTLQVMAKACQMEVARFEDPAFHDRLQAAIQEAGHRPLQIADEVLAMGQRGVTLLSVVGLLAAYDARLVALVLAAALPAFLVRARLGRLAYGVRRARIPEQRRQSYLGSHLTSPYSIKDVRLYGLEDLFRARHQDLFQRFSSENRALAARQVAATLLATATGAAGTLAGYWLVFDQAARRPLTIGDYSLLVGAMATAQGTFGALLGALAELRTECLYLDNLAEFLALPAPEEAGRREWTASIERVALHNVSFRYPGTERLVLRDVSCEVRRGEALGIVGLNGAGKTTLINLLCCLYEPTAGQVLLKGEDASAYTPRSVQRRVAALFQDFGVFSLTAGENIAIGQVDDLHNQAAVEEAARLGGAADLIGALPEGYDTLIGRAFAGGVALSGGELQRLALARALRRRGDLLILDEPTAALDAEAEERLYSLLLEDKAERITLLVSHRFSATRAADRILVLRQGACVEMGNHDELLARDGLYARLYRAQTRRYPAAGREGAA